MLDIFHFLYNVSKNQSIFIQLAFKIIISHLNQLCKDIIKQELYSILKIHTPPLLLMFIEAPESSVTFKTFILEDQNTQYSQVVPFPVNQSVENFDIQELFRNKIPQFNLMKFRIYDFSVNQYVEIQQITVQEFKLPVKFLESCQNVVLIKYRRIESDNSSYQGSFSQQDDNRSNKMSDTSSIKKQRSKQRVIAEVIEIVKKWRDLHLDKNNSKKMSLQQAAKVVGLPKKSLDDYYYQLRLGEKYGFDFKNLFFQKVGVLRNFLKEKKPRLKSNKSDKHPKKLKVLESYQQMKTMNGGSNMMEQELPNQLVQGEAIFEQPEKCEEKLQNQFYQDFGFLESQHNDPFANLDSNFKKKKAEKLFDQELFF